MNDTTLNLTSASRRRAGTRRSRVARLAVAAAASLSLVAGTCGVAAAASRQASWFASAGRAPFRPSQTEKSSIIRSTCSTVNGGPIR